MTIFRVPTLNIADPSGTQMLEGFSISDIAEIADKNSSFRGILQGYLAEAQLEKQLKLTDGITEVEKIPDQDPEKGDFRFKYKGRTLTIESKSLLSSSIRPDILNDTWFGRVQIKNTDNRNVELEGVGTIRTSSLIKGSFDILAISCYAVSQQWTFLFMENEYLPEKSKDLPNLLKTAFTVNPHTTPLLTSDFLSVVESVVLKKTPCT